MPSTPPASKAPPAALKSGTTCCGTAGDRGLLHPDESFVFLLEELTRPA